MANRYSSWIIHLLRSLVSSDKEVKEEPEAEVKPEAEAEVESQEKEQLNQTKENRLKIDLKYFKKKR